MCAEREKRVSDAVALRLPDRVPVTIQTGVFAAKYAGIPLSAMYYDHPAYREACLKTILDFEPDTGASMVLVNSGLVKELLDVRHQRWPGGNLPADTPYQFVEGEYMKAEEYDLFLDDPSDFIFRYYLPRIYGTLTAGDEAASLPHHDRGHGLHRAPGDVDAPDFKQLAEKLIKAAKEQERVRQEGVEFSDVMTYLGFPSQYGGGLGAGASARRRSTRFRII